MPRAQNISVQNNFAKGYLTEATALTFPENACTEVDNIVFDRLGSVERRFGFDFESGYSSSTLDLTGKVVVTYEWLNVAGEGDTAFVVVQVGNTIYFYKVVPGSAISANKHSHTIDLTTYFPSGVTSVATVECQFSSGNGLLFVTNERLDTFYVSYDVGSDTFSESLIDLQIRDFQGDLSDALAVDARPTSTLAALNVNHKYNLLNQGWTTATLTSWDTARTDMPSNSDVSWYFKNVSSAFDFTTVDQYSVGNSPAPKGHFIYNVYNTNRSSNSSGATDESISTERVSTSAFYTGRVFYSGIKLGEHSGKIFFTQIVQQKVQYGMCYETNDPTSETLFDLLPSDGGVINIQDAGIIFKMVPTLNALVVFASNGIWAITGSQGSGFRANDYTVSKISAVRCISHSSFIHVDGIPYWWNLDGIYTVTLDPQTNAMKVSSISDTTIKFFFDTIPAEAKQFARGIYDPFTKRIQWIYRNASPRSFEDRYVFDSFLTLSLISNAYFKWSVDTTNVRIHSILDVQSQGGAFGEVDIIDGAASVIDGSATVIIFEPENTGIDSVTKYFSSYLDGADTKVTFSECYKETYLDWETFDSIGQDFTSYFITGYKLLGKGMTRFQQNYVNIYLDNSVDSSFKIQGLWDFATTGNTGNWTTEQVFYITADDYSTKHKRIKIRGNGYACQFKVFNNGNYPFTIYGWSIFESGNKWP